MKSCGNNTVLAVAAGAALCAPIFPFCGESIFNMERELSESMDK